MTKDKNKKMANHSKTERHSKTECYQTSVWISSPHCMVLKSIFILIFQIHWFSIFNSFMMVIFLVGLVSMILMRTLRKDYARYSKEDDIDDMERDLGDEYGWKQVCQNFF